MAVESVVEWLLGDAVIDPLTCPVSHEMKLWEFISDAGTIISLQNYLPSHLYWGIIEKGARRRKSDSNTYAAGEWFDRLLEQVKEQV
ncbi:hypothetical protein JCGZ_03907 [Jatropha curcas]|uniref:Uncharacterized protein n=1 Tax=Jatropha curcas TaxID=180498 RepID=A0A067LR61_JATCU|nr:hypothetical protein JCGZ_03907 [Jatropha curcas]